MYKAVLFDMDGTVLDTSGDLTDAVNHCLRHFGMPERSRQEVESFLGNGAARLISLSVPKDTDEKKIREIFDYYSNYYSSHCQIKTAPYPGIIPLMERLKELGIKQAVISNKQDAAVKPLAKLHFPGLLELAVGEGNGVKRKPDPSAVIAAAEQLGLGIEECVYIGDTEVDIETAKNAGMDCIAVSWGFRTVEQLIQAGAGLIVHTAEELLEVLLNN